jgi:hypothetical protein
MTFWLRGTIRPFLLARSVKATAKRVGAGVRPAAWAAGDPKIGPIISAMAKAFAMDLAGCVMRFVPDMRHDYGRAG